MDALIAIFLLDLTAFPITYFLDSMISSSDENVVLGIAIMTIAAIILALYFIIERSCQPKPNDWFIYIFAFATWTCTVDLILALQADGVISNFMAFYLKEGEPYLTTPHGILINYWDGTGHYIMYLLMIRAILHRESYRRVGLYWFGSIMNSLLVYLPGCAVGRFGQEIKSSFVLNIPFVLLPIYAGYRFLNKSNGISIKKEPPSIRNRPTDLILIAYLLFAISLAFLRAMAALDSPVPIVQTYLKYYEPYIQDTVAYPKMQMLVYYFYYVPYYCATIYALVCYSSSWVSDWALIHAGAAAQAQITYIFSALHSATPAMYRVSCDTKYVFLVINLILLVVPQVMAWRIYKQANTRDERRSSG